MAELKQKREILLSDEDVELTGNILETAFRIFLQEKIVRNQQEFSKLILGMKPNYYSSMRARNRRPSDAVLENLLKQTKLFLFSCKRNPYFGEPRAKSLNRTHDRLDALANTISDELFMNWVNNIAY